MDKSGFQVRWYYVALVVVAVAILGGAGWYAYARGKPEKKKEGPHAAQAESGGQEVVVEVTRPEKGGLERVSTQPGTIEPFEEADLYAKVSGYLQSQTLERLDKGPDGQMVAKPVLKDGKAVFVDIGTKVQAGDILARISVPEYEKQVDRAVAQVKDANARVKQMEAHLVAAKAESRAADKAIDLAKVNVKAKAAFREYRSKQLERIKGLVAEKAVDAKLLDEQEEYFLAAQEAENAANEKVNTSIEQANAAKARITQAEADLDEAKAQVGVHEAELGKAKVLLDYTVITSPYDGVITRRNFFPGKDGRYGAFIKSADEGGHTPLFTVERIDTMRVVVQVPDRDVPYVSLGDPAVIQIDALSDPALFKKTTSTKPPRRNERYTFTAGVSRWADAEDPATRTMRTEIDVPNPDGLLRHGMYGSVTLVLAKGTPGALTIPSAALVGKAEDGNGTVRVVRGGKVHVAPVTYTTDNGVRVEVVSGLAPGDEIITRASGPVEEGTPVKIDAAGSGGATGH
jgi:RND family efflux transporter MFP subunit